MIRCTACSSIRNRSGPNRGGSCSPTSWGWRTPSPEAGGGRRGVAAFLAAAVSLHCYGEATGPRGFTSIADLQGSWALTEWRAVSVTHPTQSLDLLAAFSAIATLDVQPDGTASFTVSLYGQSPSVDHATLTLTADTLRYDGISNDGTFLLSGVRGGAVMTWIGIVPQYMDVNGDGLLDETRTRMAFRRSRSAVAQMMH